ncbi:DNA-binding transcriptional MerR regulator [Leucobacter exalbidus]|uniref:DNA-binding transcriptional MerR regulator n=1 Tax=Leucobacter exalbidus TaxID=662960 RepID=A0A940T449_9MICO|nr:MerR family transcriptional regulator [Leucobacter exalbidus]MBP1326508.1 DNA-binding transcriptional MerR regulator [Leucobacter exalbidus]
MNKKTNQQHRAGGAEWPIKDVARATGPTSRALRHYEKIGLLLPSRVASNGYRFYGEPELSRLYRILSLRALDLPLASIQVALADESTLERAIADHLALLEARQVATAQQIAAVQLTLDTLQKGRTMSIEEIFAGFDHGQYEGEVRERWGDSAWEASAKRRDNMGAEQQRDDDQRSLDVNAALRSAAESGDDPAGAPFQALVAHHHRWVTEYWGGRAPNLEEYTGLAELYVADARFAATYGGQPNAEVINGAMKIWAATNLS